ncbi:hypothetical protein F5141DRAFT_1219439 [Pisolithus sp. B1]|nr:hypothetical protein F5141DRAFT_1219439 [Pisolithus sp. B1]
MPTENLWINTIYYRAQFCTSFMVVFVTVDELSDASRDFRDALNLWNDLTCDLLPKVHKQFLMLKTSSLDRLFNSREHCKSNLVIALDKASPQNVTKSDGHCLLTIHQ